MSRDVCLHRRAEEIFAQRDNILVEPLLQQVEWWSAYYRSYSRHWYFDELQFLERRCRLTPSAPTNQSAILTCSFFLQTNHTCRRPDTETAYNNHSWSDWVSRLLLMIIPWAYWLSFAEHMLSTSRSFNMHLVCNSLTLFYYVSVEVFWFCVYVIGVDKNLVFQLECIQLKYEYSYFTIDDCNQTNRMPKEVKIFQRLGSSQHKLIFKSHLHSSNISLIKQICEIRLTSCCFLETAE